MCRRTGSKVVLTGSIAKPGSQYLLGLQAIDCNTGDGFHEGKERAASKEDLIKSWGTRLRPCEAISTSC